MADSLEEYLARKRQGGTTVPASTPSAPAAADPLEAYLTKRRPPPTPAVVDMGPEARRARAGMPHVEDLPAMPADLDPGFDLRDKPTGGAGGWLPSVPDATPFAPGSHEHAAALRNLDLPANQRQGVSPGWHGVPGDLDPATTRGPDADPLATSVTTSVLGAGAGRVVSPIASKVLPARAVPVATAATEGAVASKTAGGDALTGAITGGAIPALGAAAGGVRSAVAAGAPARVAKRTQQNLTGPVAQKIADKVSRVIGEHGEDLAPVLDRNPQLREALALQADRSPERALQSVQQVKGAANAARNADFDAMQAYHADKPPTSQATIASMLDDYKAEMKATGIGDRDRQAALKAAYNELLAFGDDLRAAQGLPPAANGDYSGTVVSPNDLRAFEQTIGRRAFPDTTPNSVKAKVSGALYKPIARQVNALAEATPGVDAARFATTGEDIHVLIPVEESLAAQAKKMEQGKLTLTQLAREHAGKLATIGAGALGIGGRIAASPAVVGAAVAVPAAIAAKRVAGRVGRRIDFNLAEAARRGEKAPPPRQLPPFGAAAAARAADQDDDQPGLSRLY